MFTFIPSFSFESASTADTVDTTRVNYGDIYNFNVAVTKMIYPGLDIKRRPHAVILVPSDKWQYGLCASSIVHFPINAPILFTEKSHLPPAVLNEIQRLGPTGENVPAKVLLVGPISKGVENQLIKAGLTTYRISAKEDVYELCVDVADFRLNKVPPSSETGQNDIIVVSGEDYKEGIASAFFAAHMGTPILLVEKDRLTAPVASFIHNNPHKNYYIVGSTKTVGQNVEAQVRGLVDHVERISGSDPYAIAVNFSKYSSPVDGFGWKHNHRDGWAFTYGELQNWHHIISGALFAHLGKHSPLLFTGKIFIPEVVKNYVVGVNPEPPASHMPPYMHAYILGDANDISHQVQVEIEKITNIRTTKEH